MCAIFSKPFTDIVLFHLEPEYISLGTKKQMWEL